MKLKVFIPLILLGLSFSLLSSCYKDNSNPIEYGVWNIDTSGVKVAVEIDPIVKEQNPEAYLFLSKNIQNLRKSIMNPIGIELKSNNLCDFQMKDGTIISGTTIISDRFIEIKNNLFIDGIIAIVYGKSLELYFPREYLIEKIKSMQEKSFNVDIYDELIVNINGTTLFYSE